MTGHGVVFDPVQGQVVNLTDEITAGTGAVTSVAGKNPDLTGAVTLAATDVGATSPDDAAAISLVLGG